MTSPLRIGGFLGFLLSFLIFASVAYFHLREKAWLPEEYLGSLPLFVNGVRISNADQLEFYTAQFAIGNVAEVSGGALHGMEAVHLASYYTMVEILSHVVVAATIFALGLLVYFFRPLETAALLFHLTSMAASISLLGVKTIVGFNPSWMGTASGLVFFAAYGLVPVLFFHFSCVFPTVRWMWHRRLMPALYAVAGLVGVLHYVFYLDAFRGFSIEAFSSTAEQIATAQQAFMFLLIAISTGNIARSYMLIVNRDDRKKLRWILLGLCGGIAPFLLFWLLPQILRIQPIIPEYVFKISLLVIPISFAIGIVRHKLFDIDLILNRSVVYLVVIGGVFIVYSILVASFVSIFGNTLPFSLNLLFASSATVIALLLSPLRAAVQRVVDRLFFRIEYDFRHAQRRIVEEIKQAPDLRPLAELVVRRVDELIPAERIGFFTINWEGPYVHLHAHKNYDILEAHRIRFEVEKLKSRLTIPVALQDRIVPEVLFEVADELVFRRWGMVLVLPLISTQSNIVLGFLVLGEKKSGVRYTEEDVDLLGLVAAQSALTLERLNLQERLVLERAESKRLSELNALKSFFVSSVSHDLKTPLTSIRMFAEMLRTKKRADSSEAHEYLQIIEGESMRLTRLINNVLDFARIERGVREYAMAEVELNELVDRSLRGMEYQFRMQHCEVKTQLAVEPIHLVADADALVEALQNILSNAVRYTRHEKRINIATTLRDGWACVSVNDNGIGMSEEEIGNLFQPFYRTEGGKQHGKGGVGLGLSVVKHFVDAHSGRIEVKSEPGKGTTFTIHLPLQPHHSNNEQSS